MSIIVPNISETFILGLILGKNTQPQNQVLRLFKNPHIPGENTTLSDLQEADQQGYSSILLSPNDWSISQISGDTTATCSEKEFVFTSSATIYGYYITTNHTEPLLILVEKFSNTQFFQTPESGGSIKIVPKISLS